LARDELIRLSRGVYCLLIRLGRERSIKPRRGVSWLLPEGYYIYTGSALGRSSTSLEMRLERHLRVDKKTFWHIDRLLDGSAKVVKVFYAETTAKLECDLNQKISTLLQAKPVKGFGSSDCKYGCIGHLLYLHQTTGDPSESIRKAYYELGLQYKEQCWLEVK